MALSTGCVAEGPAGSTNCIEDSFVSFKKMLPIRHNLIGGLAAQGWTFSPEFRFDSKLPM